METESPIATISTNRKRKRCPEAETIDGIIPNAITECLSKEFEPPCKKQKLSTSDIKEEEESSHFLSNYESNTLTIHRMQDIDRFHDEDDVNRTDSFQFNVLKPPNYVAATNDDRLSPIWVRLSDIFSNAFKYTARTKPTPNTSKKQFIEALGLFLKRNCIQHSVDTFYTLFRGRYYISERGFCLLLVIMRDFDSVSHFVKHFCFYRFYYRQRIFGTAFASLDTNKATQSIDDIMICNTCCLEDILRNFNTENPCDCQCILHMNCNEMRYDAPPQDVNDVASWFCGYCVASGVSRDVLMQRRQDVNESGEFEVAGVIDYDCVEDQYVVKWKHYPDEARCGIPLSMSFMEWVDVFWSEHDGKIPKHAAKAIAKLKKKAAKKLKKKAAKKLKKAKKKEKENISSQIPLKEKFIPVQLTDVMDPKFIIRRQKYTKNTYERRRCTIDKYRKWMVKEVERESATGVDIKLQMAANNSDYLPKFHLRGVNREWDCDLPRIRDIILAHLGRDWGALDAGNVSCSLFVIGDIIDPNNPAKKYGGDQGVHEQKAYGLFARDVIKKDTLLFEYAGCVKPIGEASKRLDYLETELDQTTLFDLIGHLDADRSKNIWGNKANDQLVIDPSKWHNEGVYMNDYRDRVMDDPDDDEDGCTDFERKQNVKFYEVLVNGWPRVFAVALCDIDVGEELLGDYGDDFWSNFRLMMRRQQQLKQIKKRINDEWQSKYDELQNQCQKLQKELHQIKMQK
eukprot:618932_1